MTVLAKLQALSNETRFKIINLVRDRELTAGTIAKRFDLTRPAVSQHLTVLLESRLVSVRRVGTQRLYQANRDEITHLRSELESFWDGRLHRLKAAAEQAQKRKGKTH